MKKEQITIRIPIHVKDLLTDMAEEQNISPSELIRHILSDAVEKKAENNLLDLFNKMEENLKGVDWTNHQMHFGKTIAMIISMETGIPIDEVIIYNNEITMSTYGVKSLREIDAIPREHQESIVTQILSIISDKFRLSNYSLAIIRSIALTYLGIQFNQDFISSHQFSLDTLRLYRKILDSKRCF